MEDRYINIAYACNDNYVLPISCSIKSLIYNLKKGSIANIFVLHGKTSLNNQSKHTISLLNGKNCKIEFIPVDEVFFEKLFLNKFLKHITRETYYRYILPNVLPDINKILYLDCDTIVLKDISDICDVDLSGNYIAGVRDFSEKAFIKRLSIKKYCNAGVLLFNLEKMRLENSSEKLFDFTIKNSESLPWQDQDAINIVLQEGITYLEDIWNTQIAYYTPYRDDIFQNIQTNSKIVHYICEKKPWQKEYESNYKLLFFEYFYKLPKKLQKMFLNNLPKTE